MVLKVLESNKKKILFLVVLLVIFIVIQLFLFNKNHKYSIIYEINEFTINEEYNFKLKNSYYLNIIHNDNVFSYQFNNNYIGKKIITDIKYYKDKEVECILPLFNGEVLFDFTCVIDKDYYIYLHNLTNISNGLNDFVNSIKEYDINKFKDTSNYKKVDMYNIYADNILKDVSIETYKGIINYSNKVKEIKLFDNDKYTKKLSTYTANYYVVPDYESEYGFKKIFIVNLKNNSVKTIKLDSEISFSSYIQGVEKDIIYLYDLENKKQYKVDPKKLIVKEIGNLANNINVYSDKVWTKKTVSEISDNLLFDFKGYRTKIDNNTYVDTVNNYTYTYIKDDNEYKVYKSNKYSPNIKNYLFNISDIDSVIYDNDCVYFKKDNYIAYYSERLGLKKIIQGNELSFNKNIIFNIIL